MRNLAVFSLSVVAVLSACSVGPSFEKPAPHLPDQWHGQRHDASAVATSSTTVDPQWWKQFGDPTLNELVARALAGNLDLRLAALRVAESRAQRAIAAGGRWPGVNASATYQRERQSEYGVNTRLIDVIGTPNRDQIISALAEPFDVYQGGFDASWELDLWGRVRRSVEAADASAAASREDLHDAEVTLIAEVVRTYLELTGTRDQLRIALEDVAAGSDELALTQYRVHGGLVAHLDLSVQQAQVASVRAQIPALQQHETVLTNALAFLLGQDPDTLDTILADSKAPVTMPALAAGVPSELARRRPDIRRAEARLHAATAQIGIAVADLYPRISLNGSFVQQSLDASDFAEWGARQWSVGPSISLPIFSGGRLHSVVELRKVQQQEAAVSYQRTVLNAWHEIENSLAAYAAEQQRNRELANVLAASRDAYEVAHVRYQHGLTNYLIDLDAHRTLLEAQRAFSESNTQLGVQLVALCKALGGGWSEGDSES
jgi:NodT family efflux transporter outer membrane factor (OMF) lipoprotein